jgi:predicted TPR repeat methyltransferase
VKSAAEHYDTHLARIYAWMVGNLDSAQKRAGAELADMGIGAAGADARAVDLGAGLGLHSAALGRLGYRVLAIDGCEPLLAELRERCAGLPVQAVHGELRDFAAQLDAPATVVLCLGDTLTHLASVADVEQLLGRVADALAPGGVFAASFRDYVTRELKGDERYILVRRDEERVLTCFLEYAPEHVTVSDILTERQGAAWVQSESRYAKLRLAPARVAEWLTARGLQARVETAPAGMVRVVATRRV